MKTKIISILFLSFLMINFFVLYFSYSLLAESSENVRSQSDTLKLIEYQLHIIKIDESDITSLGLNEIRLDFDINTLFSFIAADTIIQLAGIAGNTFMELEAYHSTEKNIEFVSPSVLTIPGKSVSLKLSEEILLINSNLSAGFLRENQFWELKIRAERIDHKGQVLTDLHLGSGNINTSIKTNLWSEPQKTQLLGLLNWSRQNIINEYLFSKEKESVTTFAVYLSHNIIDLEEERKTNIVNIDGLNEMLWPELEHKKIVLPNYIQLLSSTDIDMLIIDPEQKTAFQLTTKDNFKIIFAGIDTIIYEDLRLGLRVIKNRIKDNQELEIALVVSERVSINQYLELSGAYYPVFYSIQNDEVYIDQAYWMEIVPQYRSLSTRLKYSSNLGDSNLRLLLGLELEENIQLLAGARGNIDAIEEYLFGIRLIF